MKRSNLETGGHLSRRTLTQWLLACLLVLSGLMTTLTGIYLLFFPSGGYQGGRNPHYGEAFLFSSGTWIGIHTWAGIVMVVVAVAHIALHRRWLAEMAKRSIDVARGRRRSFNRKTWTRIGVVAAVGLPFLAVAVSGIYSFAVPGGHGSGAVVQFLVSRSVWKQVHTWTGVAMIVAAVVHLSMRWTWLVKVAPGAARTAVRWAGLGTATEWPVAPPRRRSEANLPAAPMR
jgi:hypothetical protein